MRKQLIITKLFDIVLLATLCVLSVQTHYRISRPLLDGIPWQFETAAVYLVDVLMVVSVLLGFFSKKQSVSHLRFIWWLMGLFFGSLAIAAIVFPHIIASFVLVGHVGIGIAFAWALAASRLKIRWLVLAFAFGVACASVVGFWQFASQQVVENSVLGVSAHLPEVKGSSVLLTDAGRYLRAYGTLAHPNIFGGYAAMAFVLLVYIGLRSAQKKVFSSLWIGCTFLVFIGLILSFSRSAWFAACAGVGVLLVISIRQWRREWFRVWAVVVSICLVLLSIWSGLLYPLFSARISAQAPTEVVSLEDRRAAILDTIEVVRQNGLSGVGITQFTRYVFEHIDSDRQWWSLQPPHNAFLVLLAEASIVPAALFIFLLGALIQLGIRAMKKIFDVFPRSACAVALVASLLPIALFDHYIVTTASGIFLLSVVFGFSLRSLSENSDQ